jgi:hypothetical protein
VRLHELIAQLQKLAERLGASELAVVFPDSQERGHVVVQAVITKTHNWMSPTKEHPKGELTRCVYLNPPMRDLDRLERENEPQEKRGHK